MKFALISGGRFGAGRRSLPDPRSSLQINRQYNLLLHSVGGDAADVQANGEPAGEAATEHRWDRSRLVIGMAGCSSRRTRRGRLAYCHVH